MTAVEESAGQSPADSTQPLAGSTQPLAGSTQPHAPGPVSFDRHPETYRHWRLSVDGAVAWLELDVDEDAGLVPGYELKLNSYDLGVDIELYDAIQRIRFEHPGVRSVVLTSGKDGVFCAGANIQMLGASPHAWKVNFCKFTNETRGALEDASACSGITWIAGVNGVCAGGGYELALACDRIVLIDDNSSTVGLPEVPLLGVLPGTGGLTRVVEKRRVRKDRADVLATRSDGIKGKTALEWGLVDELAPRREFRETLAGRASEAAQDDAVDGTVIECTGPADAHPADVRGIALPPLRREAGSEAIRYPHVSAEFDRAAGTVEISVAGPSEPAEGGGSAEEGDAAGDGPHAADPHAAGADSWVLAVTRELDDLILRLRVNEPELGTWLIRTAGDAGAVAEHEAALLEGYAHGDWLCIEIVHYYKRVLRRLDVTSRSLIALIEPGSCFTGMLLELALACDRQYMLDGPPIEDEDSDARAAITVTEVNFGHCTMDNGISRLASRFYGHDDHLAWLRRECDRELGPAEAAELGLVTEAFDDIDWEDEIRLVVQARAALSPDALTGMEANHRFVGPETMQTKIFGRLSAWQNWIFQRPNASGEAGALRRYGTGQKAQFDRGRV